MVHPSRSLVFANLLPHPRLHLSSRKILHSSPQEKASRPVRRHPGTGSIEDDEGKTAKDGCNQDDFDRHLSMAILVFLFFAPFFLLFSRMPLERFFPFFH